MNILGFTRKPIGITYTFKNGDKRLTEKTDIICNYADKHGNISHRTVSVTLAEKQLIESIAMRLFMEHKKVVRKLPEGEDGRITLQSVICVDMWDELEKAQ